MSTSASYKKSKIAVYSLSSVTYPEATYWYRAIENGEQIIWDNDDYKKFYTKFQENSVMLSLEGWVYVEKVIRYEKPKTLLCLHINFL